MVNYLLQNNKSTSGRFFFVLFYDFILFDNKLLNKLILNFVRGKIMGYYNKKGGVDVEIKYTIKDNKLLASLI